MIGRYYQLRDTEELWQAASGWRRVGGFLLDWLFIDLLRIWSGFLVYVAVMGAFGAPSAGSPVYATASLVALLAGIAALFVAPFVYLAIFWAKGGRSLGQMVAGIRVIDPQLPTMQGVTWGRAWRRSFGYFACELLWGIPFLFGMHDWIGGTDAVTPVPAGDAVHGMIARTLEPAGWPAGTAAWAERPAHEGRARHFPQDSFPS